MDSILLCIILCSVQHMVVSCHVASVQSTGPVHFVYQHRGGIRFCNCLSAQKTRPTSFSKDSIFISRISKCEFGHVPQHKEFKSEIPVSCSQKNACSRMPQDKAGSISVMQLKLSHVHTQREGSLNKKEMVKAYTRKLDWSSL